MGQIRHRYVLAYDNGQIAPWTNYYGDFFLSDEPITNVTL